jgi:hypothetical protein
MPIAVFAISGALSAMLTVLAVFGVRVIRQEYRNHQERRWRRRGLTERISAHLDVPYQQIKPGKHRLEGCRAAHELCTDEDRCAYLNCQNGMVYVDYYFARAELEQRERHEREARALEQIPWPREEDVWAGDRFSGLLCGYRTPSSFPGLSTPSGSRTDLTAASTSMPREPTSVGR